MADCGCSGIRTCLLCESKNDVKNSPEMLFNDHNKLKALRFCTKCQKLYSGIRYIQNTTTMQNCSDHDCFQDIVTGITVIEDFVTKNEEATILAEIENFPWRISQSGRKKQDFGPKVNFKKKKLKAGNFTGLPNFSRFLVERIHKDVPQLQNFKPVELCNLDYRPERGASIDPHLDDTWLWGEHLVTINLLSDTVLTLTNSEHFYEIRIPMPRHSLVILKGQSRYNWMHGIKREDIKMRRIAVTLRELSGEFLSGQAYMQIGKPLLELALSYNGLPTST